MGNRRQNIWINDISIRDADRRVLITRIEEGDNEVDTTFSPYAGRDGRLLTGYPMRRAKTVRVVFRIRELYDLPARAAAIDAVNAWAQDGILQLSSRPGRQLRVVCTKRAAGGNLKDYTAEYAVEFATESCPFWEDDSCASASGSVSASTGLTLMCPGSADTAVESVDLTCTTITASAFKVSCVSGGVTRFFKFSTALADGNKVEIRHDGRGILSARKVTGTTSTDLLPYRTADSADDLYISPGAVSVSFAAYDGNGDATTFTATAAAQVRGRYL